MPHLLIFKREKNARIRPMKRVLKPASRNLLLFYRAALFLVLFLTVLVISGTVYGIFRPSGAQPLFRIGAAAGDSGAGQADAGGTSVFTGIGRLRIPIAGASGGGATLILSISFPYPPHDQPFAEELASRITSFRSIASDYFSSLPANQIANLDEEAVKTEILRRYNASLRLGKIEALYFHDLMILE